MEHESKQNILYKVNWKTCFANKHTRADSFPQPSQLDFDDVIVKVPHNFCGVREAFQLVVGFPVLPFLAQLVLLDVETLDPVEAVEFGGQVGPKLEKPGTLIISTKLGI